MNSVCNHPPTALQVAEVFRDNPPSDTLDVMPVDSNVKLPIAFSRAYACYPLIVHDRLIGTLSFGIRTRDCFLPEDLDLMKTVADQVAAAMDRKRILLDLQRSRDELEVRVQERTVELDKRARQLSFLASELTLVEERERRRLAGILHDNLQQLLVAAKMNIEILTGSVAAAQRPTIEHILDLMTQSIKVSRSLTDELSPPLLQHYGLLASLKWLGRWMREMHGLTVDLSVDSSLDPKQEDFTVLLFQSVRELLFNVVKHAGVKSARVEMHQDKKGRGRIVVSDQGVGFDSKIIREDANTNGLGLFSIRERMMLMGGCLEVESEPGMGASFSLVLPLEKTGSIEIDIYLKISPGPSLPKRGMVPPFGMRLCRNWSTKSKIGFFVFPVNPGSGPGQAPETSIFRRLWTPAHAKFKYEFLGYLSHTHQLFQSPCMLQYSLA